MSLAASRAGVGRDSTGGPSGTHTHYMVSAAVGAPDRKTGGREATCPFASVPSDFVTVACTLLLLYAPETLELSYEGTHFIIVQ